MPDQYELAAMKHDIAEIERLRDYLKKADPAGEIQFAGCSVVDWAISRLKSIPEISPL